MSSKVARVAIVYAVLMAVLLVLLMSVDEGTSIPRKQLDRLLLVALVVLYCVARFAVLPWWDSLSARGHVEGSKRQESVRPRYVSYIATLTALLVALVVWSLQIHMGVKFPEQAFRQSALQLMPALGSLLVGVAVVCLPERERGSIFLLLTSLLEWAVLFAFAMAAVFFVPALALETWYDTYTSEDYEQAVRPLWLALPAAALLYKLVRKHSR